MKIGDISPQDLQRANEALYKLSNGQAINQQEQSSIEKCAKAGYKLVYNPNKDTYEITKKPDTYDTGRTVIDLPQPNHLNPESWPSTIFFKQQHQKPWSLDLGKSGGDAIDTAIREEHHKRSVEQANRSNPKNETKGGHHSSGAKDHRGHVSEKDKTKDPKSEPTLPTENTPSKHLARGSSDQYLVLMQECANKLNDLITKHWSESSFLMPSTKEQPKVVELGGNFCKAVSLWCRATGNELMRTQILSSLPIGTSNTANMGQNIVKNTLGNGMFQALATLFFPGAKTQMKQSLENLDEQMKKMGQPGLFLASAGTLAKDKDKLANDNKTAHSQSAETSPNSNKNIVNLMGQNKANQTPLSNKSKGPLAPYTLDSQSEALKNKDAKKKKEKDDLSEEESEEEQRQQKRDEQQEQQQEMLEEWIEEQEKQTKSYRQNKFTKETDDW